MYIQQHDNRPSLFSMSLRLNKAANARATVFTSVYIDTEKAREYYLNHVFDHGQN